MALLVRLVKGGDRQMPATACFSLPPASIAGGGFFERRSPGEGKTQGVF
jgi:hypothetical protein